MTKFPIVKKVCLVCGATTYGKDVIECAKCGCSSLVEEVT